MASSSESVKTDRTQKTPARRLKRTQPKNGTKSSDSDEKKRPKKAAKIECANDSTQSTSSSTQSVTVNSLLNNTKKPDGKILLKFGKTRYHIPILTTDDVIELKKLIQEITDITTDMQKLIHKGKLLKEGKLTDYNVKDGSVMILIGSRKSDVEELKRKKPTVDQMMQNIFGQRTQGEPLCQQRQHILILEKGLPPNALPGIKGVNDPLPTFPIPVLSKHGVVRLTFKLEFDQLWLQTNERTDKIDLQLIRRVSSEPIELHDEYHIMALDLGPTEKSRFFMYWVPAQYVEAIKRAITGN